MEDRFFADLPEEVRFPFEDGLVIGGQGEGQFLRDPFKEGGEEKGAVFEEKFDRNICRLLELVGECPPKCVKMVN